LAASATFSPKPAARIAAWLTLVAGAAAPLGLEALIEDRERYEGGGGELGGLLSDGRGSTSLSLLLDEPPPVTIDMRPRKPLLPLVGEEAG